MIADNTRRGRRPVPAWRRLRVASAEYPLTRLQITEALAVGAICVAATVLRIADLGRVGFSSDEAVYAGQGAALFGDERLAEFFSIFRAHPLLLQGLVGALFNITGPSDVAARALVAMVFGVGSVLVTYALARLLYGGAVAAAAALLLAVMPYHVLVSRQVILDTPLSFFTVLTFLFVARGVRAGGDGTPSPNHLILAAASAAAATLSKETGILLFPAIALIALLTGWWRQFTVSALLWAGLVSALILAPFFLSRLLFSAGGSASYVLWQFLRPPNHSHWYIPGILLQYASPVFVGFSAIGLARIAIARRPADWLMLVWLVVILGFILIWPTKLFAYLMVVVPALAILASVGIVWAAKFVAGALGPRARVASRTSLVVFAATLLVATPMTMSSIRVLNAGPDQLSNQQFDLEVHEFAGAREAGEWARENTPTNARFMTIGPSLGNVIAFYGNRPFVALSVSTDPALRNPAYIAMTNPDRAIRRGDVHYVVWDFLSANRSAFQSRRLLAYAERYGIDVVFSSWTVREGEVQTSLGPPPAGSEPLVVVYSVVGGAPLDANQASIPQIDVQ